MCERGELASVARLRRPAADDRAQLGLPYGFGRFLRGHPLDLALSAFRPSLALSQHPERVDLHFAVDDAAVLEALLVGKRSDRAAVDDPLDAGLFERFARGGMVGRPAFLRPALGDDPTPRIARRDHITSVRDLPINR